jgi:acyl dehydratase
MSRGTESDTYGEITDEGLEELRDRIGTVIDERRPYVSEATTDTIRHWANGIGTDNPLYTDLKYAQETRYEEIIAPPTFLYATCHVAGGYVGGLPGVHAMYAGTDWDWKRPIRRGDRIETKSWLHDLIEHETDFAGRSIQQIYRTEFYNQDGDQLATADSWCFRTERDTAREGKQKYESEGVELADWDESDIESFAEHYRQQEPRGSDPRYFEDVDEGEELDTLLKGPRTVTGAIAFLQGWGSVYVCARGHQLMYELFDDHPGLKTTNRYGAPEPPSRVHWDEEYAQHAGVPAPYDYGPERVSWLGHVCHHWMGDDGFLEDLYVEVRRHNLMGDATWCSGEVTEKYVEDGDRLVDVDLRARNQRDNVSAKGNATIRLPSRESGA